MTQPVSLTQKYFWHFFVVLSFGIGYLVRQMDPAPYENVWDTIALVGGIFFFPAILTLYDKGSERNPQGLAAVLNRDLIGAANGCLASARY